MKRFALAFIALCAGCGGGGSDPEPVQTTQPVQQPAPTPPPLDHAGVWVGKMTYQGLSHETLCRITPNNASPNQLTCFLLVGRELATAFLGQYGTVNIAPPNQWAATGTVYDSGSPKPFSLTGGSVTSSSISLTFSIAGSTYTFSGTPATQPTTALPQSGVYTSAYARGDISFAIDSQGALFAQGGGCTINGNVNGLPTFGLFIEADMSNCGGPNDTYTGYGLVTNSVVVPHASETTLTVFALFKGQHWLGGMAIR